MVFGAPSAWSVDPFRRRRESHGDSGGWRPIAGLVKAEAVRDRLPFNGPPPVETGGGRHSVAPQIQKEVSCDSGKYLGL
jgi:hypothetical protein